MREIFKSLCCLGRTFKCANARPQSDTTIERLETRQLLSSYFIATDSAFASLSSAHLAAGDVVLLKGGTTFHGMLYLNPSDTGTAGNPIQISSYNPKSKSEIPANSSSSARATISAGNGDGILAYDTAGVKITAINLVGSGTTKNTGSGIDFYTDLSGSTTLSGIAIDHVDVSGFHDYGIALGSGNATSGYANVTITNTSAHGNGLAGITTYGPFQANSGQFANQNIYVGYCSAYSNAGFAGMSSPTGNGIVLSDVNGAVIEDCTAYNNGSNNTNGNGPVGIWAWDANNVVIQHNASYKNHTSGGDGGGFDLDGGVTNSVMQYNYSHDNDGEGFGLYEFSGAGTWNNNIVRYNVSANNGLKNNAGEISFWTAGPSMTNAQVYDNTLVVRPGEETILLTQSNITAQISGNVIQVGGSVNLSGVGPT
jgi:hypothetical protein